MIGVMRDLKAIGAHNGTPGRRRGLTGKNTWQKAISQYETLRKEGKLPATFEVVYGHAWNPRPEQPSLRRSSDGNSALHDSATSYVHEVISLPVPVRV